MSTFNPVNKLALRRSVIDFTLKSGFPGTKMRMLTLSSEGVCLRSALLVIVTRYWKQCAAMLVRSTVFCPLIDVYASAGEPSTACQLASVQLGRVQSLSFEIR